MVGRAGEPMWDRGNEDEGGFLDPGLASVHMVLPVSDPLPWGRPSPQGLILSDSLPKD